MFIRKFYEAEAKENGAAAVAEPTKSIAELMATEGRLVNENSPAIETPDNNTEEKEEPKATKESTSDVPSDEVKKVDEVVQETPKVTEAITPKATPQIEEPAKVQPTLQEVLKQHQPDTVLKELGFDASKAKFVSDLKDADPNLVGIMDAYKSGTLGEYLNELNTDYEKMSAEDVMKRQLRVEYPKASEKALQALYEDEVVEKYKLDESVYEKEDVEKGRLLLEAKADRHRDAFIEKQKGYLLPKPPEPKDVIQEDNTEQLRIQELDKYKQQVESSPFTQSIFKDKVLVLGEGEDAFRMPIADPKSLTDTLFDSDKWKHSIMDTVLDANGQEALVPNVENSILLAAFLQSPQTFIREISKHYKSLGGKTTIESIDNASPITKTEQQSPAALPKSAAAAMASSGKLVSGGQ